MKYEKGISEVTLKNKVAKDFFDERWLDCTNSEDDKIDFTVKLKGTASDRGYLLWAEAKKDPTDHIEMLAQLALTIGKAKNKSSKLGKAIPPPYLGCFDIEKFTIVPYNEFLDIYNNHDINWNVTPSDVTTKDFKLVQELITRILDSRQSSARTYNFDTFEKELKTFIRERFVASNTESGKTRIDKNNFVHIYNKWLKEVRDTIAIGFGWEKAKENGIRDADFYLADLLYSPEKNEALADKLRVLLQSNHYRLLSDIDDAGFRWNREIKFNDNQKAHEQFWRIYERPPLEEYWDYIITRRPLLVPPDIREREGSYFTPQKWVELSQKYIADTLGENWQDEYYVWDCCAGTGNLLEGLHEKHRIWASTLDIADVDVMNQRIDKKGAGAHLLKDHVFQFDFLNDSFDKLPVSLRRIIDDPEKRKKLVVYINPPYAEATTSAGKNKEGISKANKTYSYINIIGRAVSEIHAQFFTHIYKDIEGCWLAEFSKLKTLQAPFFSKFRDFFKAKLKACFIVPANTFDNVDGSFPIGFKIWDCSIKESFVSGPADVYDAKGLFLGKKKLCAVTEDEVITKWLTSHYDHINETIAYLRKSPSDFQHCKDNFISRIPKESDVRKSMVAGITKQNLVPFAVYLAVRKVIPATWLNDRDQFLCPNIGWETDLEFQSDCIAYTLFSNSNFIQSEYGINHWIPFTEKEVGARDSFESSFMSDFLKGKAKLKYMKHGSTISMFTEQTKAINFYDHFSYEALAVLDAGKALWKYYHKQQKWDMGEVYNVNASYYDIRKHFQGVNDKDQMRNKSNDQMYNDIIGNLRISVKSLAEKIEPKVYEYGFLRD